MRTGKISENILSRSVIKPIKHKNRDKIMTGASLGSDASVTACKDVISQSSAGLMFASDKSWFESGLLEFDIKRAFFNAINNVAAECGKPYAVTVNLLLPKKTQEQDIKKMMRYLAELCQAEEIEIAGGDTEVTNNVLSPIVNFTAIGAYMPDNFQNAKKIAHDEMDIVMAGEIAFSGTAALVRLKYDELLERFAKSYVELALKTEESMSSIYASNLACKYGVRIMHDLSRGGIYGGLWELSEKTGKGVLADMNAIPVRQETIEMCEMYGLNPYKMLSNGAVLMVTDDGAGLCDYLRQNNVKSQVIGKLKNNNDKVLIKNDEKRYIEAPRGDELYHIL